MLVSYPDPNVHKHYPVRDVSDHHRYVHLGLGTRLDECRDELSLL